MFFRDLLVRNNSMCYDTRAVLSADTNNSTESAIRNRAGDMQSQFINIEKMKWPHYFNLSAISVSRGFFTFAVNRKTLRCL